MRYLVFALLLCISVSCKEQKGSTTILHEETIANKNTDYTQVIPIYTLKENNKIRKFDFKNFDRNVSLLTFLESELSFLKTNDSNYFNINYAYGMEANLESQFLLFENKPTKSFVFLFPSYSQEFPAFQVVEFTPSHLPKDYGIFTFDWQDFETLNVKNINELSYNVEKKGKTLEVVAKVGKNKSTSLSQKASSQPMTYADHESEFREIIQTLDDLDTHIDKDITTGAWAIDCENGLTFFTILNNQEGQLSLYSDNPIFINFRISEMKSKLGHFTIYFQDVASQNIYYPEKASLTPGAISTSQPIGSFNITQNGAISLNWIGLFNDQTQELEFKADFLLLRENRDQHPIILTRCD